MTSEIIEVPKKTALKRSVKKPLIRDKIIISSKETRKLNINIAISGKLGIIGIKLSKLKKLICKTANINKIIAAFKNFIQRFAI